MALDEFKKFLASRPADEYNALQANIKVFTDVLGKPGGPVIDDKDALGNATKEINAFLEKHKSEYPAGVLEFKKFVEPLDVQIKGSIAAAAVRDKHPIAEMIPLETGVPAQVHDYTAFLNEAAEVAKVANTPGVVPQAEAKEGAAPLTAEQKLKEEETKKMCAERELKELELKQKRDEQAAKQEEAKKGPFGKIWDTVKSYVEIFKVVMTAVFNAFKPGGGGFQGLFTNLMSGGDKPAPDAAGPAPDASIVPGATAPQLTQNTPAPEAAKDTVAPATTPAAADKAALDAAAAGLKQAGVKSEAAKSTASVSDAAKTLSGADASAAVSVEKNGSYVGGTASTHTAAASTKTVG